MKTGFDSGHALVIAVSNYTGVKPLPRAVINDARDIVSVLTSPQYCGFEPAKVTVLLDDDATLQNLRDALGALATRCGPRDTVLIYFSGHGARLGGGSDPPSALVPVDASKSDLRSTCLTEAEFSTALQAIRAERLMVLLDACHAGGAGSFKGDSPEDDPLLGYGEKSLGRLAQGRGRVMIASSRDSETSRILHGARNSLFTDHLLTALRGGATTRGDGLIRVFEVFNYVAEKVKAATPDQHPIFKASDLEDNFPIALDRGGVNKHAAPVVPSSGGDDRKPLEGILAELYPIGPTDQEIWVRAGGDLSRLRLQSTGRASWVAALRTLRQGGGGSAINPTTLIQAALDDFPHHAGLRTALAAEA